MPNKTGNHKTRRERKSLQLPPVRALLKSCKFCDMFCIPLEEVEETVYSEEFIKGYVEHRNLNLQVSEGVSSKQLCLACMFQIFKYFEHSLHNATRRVEKLYLKGLPQRKLMAGERGNVPTFQEVMAGIMPIGYVTSAQDPAPLHGFFPK